MAFSTALVWLFVFVTVFPVNRIYTYVRLALVPHSAASVTTGLRSIEWEMPLLVYWFSFNHTLVLTLLYTHTVCSYTSEEWTIYFVSFLIWFRITIGEGVICTYKKAFYCFWLPSLATIKLTSLIFQLNRKKLQLNKTWLDWHHMALYSSVAQNDRRKQYETNKILQIYPQTLKEP